jgi:hypothetical protein
MMINSDFSGDTGHSGNAGLKTAASTLAIQAAQD